MLNLRKNYKLFKSKLKLSFLKFYLAGRFDEKDIILISSSPRSGSTMLSNILKAIPKSCVLFEPLHLNHVPESKAAGFSWRTYLPPEKEWPEGKAFLKKVFQGKVINKWTSREMELREVFNSNTMIVKFVRATQLLPWICNNYDIQRPIILLRHPCAVIASQLKSSDWNQAKQPAALDFLVDYPLFKSALQKTETVEEHLAATWAMEYLPVLMQTKADKFIIITYEELLLHPKKALSKIFNSWNLDVDIENAVARIKTPSSVVYKSGISGIDGWKKQLSSRQIANILNIVHGFGIYFYNENVEPDYKILYDKSLSNKIIKTGLI